MKNSDMPAMPLSAIDDDNDTWINMYGLTKREMFAMAAMQGLLTDPIDKTVGLDMIAITSVAYADSVLEALESTPAAEEGSNNE